MTIGLAVLFAGLGWASQSLVGNGVGGVGTVYAATHSALPDPCDRACLEGLVDSYLAALVAHDPSRVPIARDVKFIENTVPQHPGDGLWKTASALPATFKIYVPDPVAEQVGFIGVMRESDKPVELGLRLKVRKGQIIEVEHLVARQIRDTSLPNLQNPRPGLLAVVPPAERSSREELLRIGATYYDALVNSDGHAAPFADDCLRRENGMQTTGNPPPATPGRGTMGAILGAARPNWTRG